MVKEKGDVIKAAMHVIELFNQGDIKDFYQYLEKYLDITTVHIRQRIFNIEELKQLFQENVAYGGEVVHQEYQLVIQTSFMAVVTGSYYLRRKSVSESEKRTLFYVTLVFRSMDKNNPANTLKLKHMHLSASGSGQRYSVKDIQERVFFVNEEEILYLESSHNHVIWHCDGLRFEVVGTLKHMQDKLPESFLRIHRGFLINKQHVKCVERCHVEMDDGTILQIPVKKYCEIKNKLHKDIPFSR